MNESKTASRWGSVDFMKGFIILVIVGGHLLVSSTGDSDAREMPIVIQIFYLGLMAFYIISGYFYRPSVGFKTNMKKRVMQLVVALVICAFVLPILLFIWLSICGQTPEISDLFYAIGNSLYLTDLFTLEHPSPYYATCGASVGYYYLWTMLWGFVVFYALADHVMEDKKKFAITIVALIAATMVVALNPIRLPFHMQFAPISALFMFIGAYLARLKLIEYIESLQLRNGKYWAVMLGCLIAGVVLCLFFHPGIQFDWYIFGDYGSWSVPIYVVESTLMFIAFLYMCKFLSLIPGLSNILRICGHHTLGILLLHGFIATVIIAPFFTITNTSWFPTDMSTMQRAIVFVITFVVCVLICRYGPAVVKKIRGSISKKPQEA